MIEELRIKLFFVVLVILAAGCTKRVPPGYVGMVMRPGGLTGQALAPGNHTCYGRDKLVIIETKEATITEKLRVLCKDDLNFGFDVKVRSRLKASDGNAIKDVLNRQGSNIVWEGGVGILKYDFLYTTYVQPEARSISRMMVSQYETTQIREARAVIQKQIQDNLTTVLKGTPMELAAVQTSNFDYPKVITAAVERKRKKEIEIKEEEAKQAMELLQAENRLKVAQKLKAARAAEAEAEAAYVGILGRSLTANFLRLKDIEARRVLYERVGEGDKVITGAATPMVGTPTLGAAPKK
jgi:regulator of protease activity HflC (stomatin/prohibitin superfamily)